MNRRNNPATPKKRGGRAYPANQFKQVAKGRRQLYQPGHHTDQDTRTTGLLIFMEVHRRILHGQFGAIPVAIKDWAFAEGGYCLDAPDMLPAGACEFFELDPTGMEDMLDEFGHFGLPAQITVPREPGSHP